MATGGMRNLDCLQHLTTNFNMYFPKTFHLKLKGKLGIAKHLGFTSHRASRQFIASPFLALTITATRTKFFSHSNLQDAHYSTGRAAMHISAAEHYSDMPQFGRDLSCVLSMASNVLIIGNLLIGNI